MKQIFLGIAIFTMTVATADAQKKTLKTGGIKPPKPAAGAAATKKAPSTLKTALDSFSYALGLNIANNLKQQSIDAVSNAAMMKGLNDVFNKKTPEFNEQQANTVIQQKIMGNQGKKNSAEKAKGAAFLAANKKREGVITLPDGLQYEVLKKGDQSSAMPKVQDTFVAHYAGTLIDGTKFDNSYDRGEPITYPMTSVVKGWTEVLQLMHIGDKFKVYIPSELGYGERGSGAIPGGATLIFEMELMGIKPAAAESTEQK